MTAGGGGRLRSLVLGSALAAPLAAGLAHATPASAETVLEATGGVAGFADPGEHVVVAVTVRADRLVRGTLVASSNQTGSVVEVRRDVEVAGGSDRRVLIVVPTSPYDLGPVRVTLQVDGEVQARAEVQVQPALDTELVGVLPRLEAAAGSVPATSALAVDAGTARLAALGPEVLALGPAALDAYDTIAGLAGDVADLTAPEASALADWLQRGGRLLLDDGGDPDGLPDEWRPGPAGYALAGAGEVRRTGGALARGGWAEVLEPNVVAVVSEDAGAGRGAYEQAVPTSVTLVRRSGLDIADLGWLLGLLVAYVAVAGPVVYVVLRVRRRLAAAWAVVPAIALATAAVVVVAGGRLRADATPVATGMVETWAGGGRATIDLLALSSGGGWAGATAPETWVLRTGTDVAPVPLVHQLDEGLALVLLEPGQASVLPLVGPDSPAGGLELTATSATDGAASGTVRNTLAVPLTDVAVFVREVGVLVGDLGPGESRDWAVEDATSRTDRSLASQVWSTPDDAWAVGADVFVGPDTPLVVDPPEPGATPPPSANVDLGAWGTWATSRTTTVREAGLARAVGWTAGQDAPVSAADGDPVEAVLGYTTTAPVVPAGPVPTDVSIRATLVRGPFSLASADAESALVVRFLLPPGSDASLPLALDVPAWATSPAVWDGAAWQPLAAEPGTTVALPEGVVRGGALHVRFTLFDVAEAADVVNLRVREAG